MNKNIIKNNNSNNNIEKINKTKSEINTQQVEESQKKSVNISASSAKVIKDNEPEPYVSMRDYSGKIQYNKRNQNISENLIISEAKIDIKNTDNTAEVIKPADNSDTFKYNSTVLNDVIKGDSENKPQTTDTIIPEHRTQYYSKKSNDNGVIREIKSVVINNDDNIEEIVKSKDNSDFIKHNFDSVNAIIKDKTDNTSKNKEETKKNKAYSPKKNYNSKNNSENKPYNIEKNSDNKTLDFKENSVSDIIKPENRNIESVVKNFDKGIIKDNSRSIINEYAGNNGKDINSKNTELRRNIQKNNSDKCKLAADNKKSNDNYEKPKAFKYSEEKTDFVTKKDNSVIIEGKSLKVDILPQDQKSALSYSAKDYISEKPDISDNKRSKISEIAHKETIKKISEKANSTDYEKTKAFKYSEQKTDSITVKDNSVIIEEKSLKVDILPQDQKSTLSYSLKDYISEKPDISDSKRSKISEIAHQNTIKAISDKSKILDNKEPKAFKYTESNAKTANAVKKEFSHNDVIKPETPTPIKSQVGTAAKENNIALKNDKKSKNKSGIVSYGKTAIKSSIKSQAENSEDNGLKTVAVSASAAVSAAEILKPEKDENLPKITKGDKRKIVYNKSHISQKIKTLNIRSELKYQLKDTIKQANNSVKKAINTGGSAILKSVKAEIEESGENGLAFKAVDDVIKTADKAISAKRGAKAAINTGSKAAKGIIGTGKTIKNTPRNIKSAAKNFKEKMRKRQKKKALKKARQKKTVKQAGKQIAKQTAKIIASAVSAIVVKLFILFLPLLLIIVICAAVVAIISSITWQTGTDLDTTQIIKYVAELDYNQQNNWYSKGKTNIDIERQNDNSSNSYNYHYLLAVDVPSDDNLSAAPSDNDVNCLIKLSKKSDGSERRPTYKGFNMEFSSCDEMLELYRWTTEDYRAVLAYLQVKNENLGWFASLVGFVGEYQLKSCARELHELTYNHKIVIKNTEPGKDPEYSFQTPIYNTTYTNNGSHDYYYFGRKYSVNYIIENDMIRFDSDDKENASMKERYEYVYKYGNLAVGNLIFPLELQPDEVISDRIAKHFGKQTALEYTPPERPEDRHTDVYGSVSNRTAYHYAVDLSADEGDIIYAPIKGLCKVKQREKRGFEYTICTSYNGNNFDFTKDGYLVKISCSKATYIPTASSKVVKQGDKLGIVGSNMEVNYKIPDTGNDTENEDIFADKLFPCSTFTNYHSVGRNKFEIPETTKDYIHLEMYKLPCDFSDKSDIEENVLNPELFFDFSKEVD